MVNDVAKYRLSCLSCQSHEAVDTNPGEFFQPIAVGDPFETVWMDLMGPFTLFSRRIIIFAVDHLAKWIEVKAVRACTSAAATHFFYKNIIMRHGVPRTVFTDQGSHFNSRFIQ